VQTSLFDKPEFLYGEQAKWDEELSNYQQREKLRRIFRQLTAEVQLLHFNLNGTEK